MVCNILGVHLKTKRLSIFCHKKDILVVSCVSVLFHLLYVTACISRTPCTGIIPTKIHCIITRGDAVVESRNVTTGGGIRRHMRCQAKTHFSLLQVLLTHYSLCTSPTSSWGSLAPREGGSTSASPMSPRPSCFSQAKHVYSSKIFTCKRSIGFINPQPT